MLDAAETISLTNGGSTTVSCGAVACPSGNLYQWVVNAVDANGKQEYVSQCSYVCVDDALGPQSVAPPRCPVQYCHSSACQCCNAVWGENATASDPSQYVHTDQGGSCVDPMA